MGTDGSFDLTTVELFPLIDPKEEFDSEDKGIGIGVGFSLDHDFITWNENYRPLLPADFRAPPVADVRGSSVMFASHQVEVILIQFDIDGLNEIFKTAL